MPAVNEESFMFLIACIKHAVNGKPNWEAVRKECGIVSTGAASMRYARLLKAYGVGTATEDGEAKVKASPRKRRKEINEEQTEEQQGQEGAEGADKRKKRRVKKEKEQERGGGNENEALDLTGDSE